MAYVFNSTTDMRLAALLRRLNIQNVPEISNLGADQINELWEVLHALDPDILLDDQQVSLWLTRALNSAATKVAALEGAGPTPPVSGALTITSISWAAFNFSFYTDSGFTFPGPSGYTQWEFPNLLGGTSDPINFVACSDVESINMPVFTGGLGGATPGFGISGCPALITVSIPNIDLNTLAGGLNLDTNTSLTTVNLSNMVWAPSPEGTLSAQFCALSQATVNAILVHAATFLPGITDGEIRLNNGTSAAPSGAGAAAKTALVTAGWIVLTN